MNIFLLSFFAFWVALFPVYLWGYGVSYLINEPWNRRRFLIGIWLWALSVALILALAHIPTQYLIWGILGFFVLFSSIIAYVIHRWQKYARLLLWQVIRVNVIIISSLFLIIALVSKYTNIPMIAISLMPLIIGSFFEESSKHLASIWLMSQDFRFSRRDIVIFTFFVVLGFVFAENIIYFFSDISLGTWIFRSILTIGAHLFASMIASIVWWKALSHEPKSRWYIMIFSIGFIVAILVHVGYNFILQQWSIVGLLVYMLLAYIVLAQGILNQ